MITPRRGTTAGAAVTVGGAVTKASEQAAMGTSVTSTTNAVRMPPTHCVRYQPVAIGGRTLLALLCAATVAACVDEPGRAAPPGLPPLTTQAALAAVDSATGPLEPVIDLGEQDGIALRATLSARGGKRS